MILVVPGPAFRLGCVPNPARRIGWAVTSVAVTEYKAHKELRRAAGRPSAPCSIDARTDRSVGVRLDLLATRGDDADPRRETPSVAKRARLELSRLVLLRGDRTGSGGSTSGAVETTSGTSQARPILYDVDHEVAHDQHSCSAVEGVLSVTWRDGE